MNPHRFTWSIAYDFPFAKIVAIVTIFGLLLTKDKMSLPRRRETILIILLGLYFTFTSLFAFNSFAVWAQWEKVIKILIMTLVTLILINDREKLKYLVMVIAFSIGFLGIKGGIFSIATSGQYRIYGPEGSFFGDNNDLALALNMILPMLFYLARDEENRYLKMACWFTFVMSIVAVIFTYSRGGFLTLVGVLTILTFKSRYKVLAFSMIFFIAIISTPFIPAKWFDRIESIKAYEQDRSALGRINAWYTAWNIAKDRPFVGGGFETFTREVFSLYAPDPEDVHDVHSIYFEILGEHGIIAFVLFVILITSTVSSTQRLKKITENDVRFKWVENYSNMFQISLIAYMIGGIFLGRAYFDLFYHIVAMVVIMKVLVEKEKELRI
jgi:probable O-glycosylation ligase (exosortase A-associated)